MESAFHVLVLTCGDLGFEVAARLAALPGVTRVSLMVAPYRQRRRTFWGKVKHVWRTQGPIGYVDIVRERLKRRRIETEELGAHLPDLITVIRVDDFHSPAALEKARALAPDLGVVAGTYILKPAVFELPRLGCINLHSGKVPEYRGSAPAFWELYNGETRVGITIHRVSAALDAGPVLRQELFPIDPAPAEEPLEYVERYRREVLRPEGVRLLVEAVEQVANGTVDEREQSTVGARTYPSPTWVAKRELHRRVAGRRAGA